MKFQKLGILGCGQMGAGIAEVAARADVETVLKEIDQKLLDQGLERVRSSLERARDRSKLSPEDCERSLANISGTLSADDLADCDLVVEAIVEDLAIKKTALAAWLT